MTVDLRDLRAKISSKADQTLAGVALARGIDKQDVVRDVLDQWADKILHECSVVTNPLRLRRGMRGEDAGVTHTIQMKNWEKFLHYKDRDPPWINLYRDLLSAESWVLGRLKQAGAAC